MAVPYEHIIWRLTKFCTTSCAGGLWPFDLESDQGQSIYSVPESDVQVTCDVAYLCANFSLPKPLCSRLRPAVRSVTLNLANKFSQCTFSVAEHYDLFCGLIILRQARWRRSYDVIPHRPHRTDRETAAGKAQRYHTDLKLIYMLPIMHYTTRRQF